MSGRRSLPRRKRNLRPALIGPADHGRPMRLADFEFAKVREGHLYELGRGVVMVSPVPNPSHGMAIFALRQQLSRYDHANPGVLWGYCGGSECKILVDPFQSERHPDLAVYKTSPPTNDDSVWSIWVPEIVIEVVAPNSVERDYHEKPEEYLAFGVREYWVIDPERKLMEAHLRSGGGWLVTTIKPPKKHKSIMLPGFRLDLAKVLAAAATPPKPKR